MLSIRLSRQGKKKFPIYRIIITEKSRDPYGKYLEILGTYNPHTKKTELKAERIKYWLSQGAQATATVHNLLVSNNVIEAKKVKASKSKPGKKKRAELKAKEKSDLSMPAEELTDQSKIKEKELKAEHNTEEDKEKPIQIKEKTEEPSVEDKK